MSMSSERKRSHGHGRSKGKGVKFNEGLNTIHRYLPSACFTPTAVSPDVKQVERSFISYANNYKIFMANRSGRNSAAKEKRDRAMLEMMCCLHDAFTRIYDDQSIRHATPQISRICSNLTELSKTIFEIWKNVYDSEYLLPLSTWSDEVKSALTFFKQVIRIWVNVDYFIEF